jgi:hypothetical protein
MSPTPFTTAAHTTYPPMGSSEAAWKNTATIHAARLPRHTPTVSTTISVTPSITPRVTPKRTVYAIDVDMAAQARMSGRVGHVGSTRGGAATVGSTSCAPRSHLARYSPAAATL